MAEEEYLEPKTRSGFLQFLRKIWSAKITFAVSFGVAMILVPLAISLLVNPSRATYQSEIQYRFDGAEGNTFADGSVYNYFNNVSYESLAEAKSKSVSFETIDVKKMALNGDISVAIVETTSGTEVIRNRSHLVYTVKQSYFPNVNVAREFLDTLIELPANKAKSISVNQKYDSSLVASKAALSYDSEIQYLATQTSLLNNGYQYLLEKYGNGLTYVKDGSTILVSEQYTSFQNFFADFSVSTLQEVLRDNGFVKSTDVSAKIEAEARITEIERTIDQNTIEINALTDKYKDIYKGDSTTGESPFATRIQELITQNTALSKEKEYLLKKLSHINNSPTEEEIKAQEEFEQLIENISAALESFASDYTDARHFIDTNAVLTSYVTSAHIERKNEFAWYISVVAGVAVGLVAGLIIAYFRGTYKAEKKEQI